MCAKAWVAMFTLMACFEAAAVHADPHRLELKDGATTIAVTEQTTGATDVLHVVVSGGANEGHWDYKDLSLDSETEPAGAPAVEIQKTPKGAFLLVHAYSGGADCCWSLLMFNLDTGKPLGEVLSGTSSIQVAKGSDSCLIQASTVPVADPSTADSALIKPRRYCFDGVRFKARGRRAGATSPSNGG